MRFLVVILIVAYCAPAVFRFVAVGDYLMRQDYYAQVLCVDKDKPISTCNGRCQIESFAEQESNGEQPPALPPFMIKTPEIEAILNIDTQIRILFNVLEIEFKPHTDEFLISDFISRIFVPPERSVEAFQGLAAC